MCHISSMNIDSCCSQLIYTAICAKRVCAVMFTWSWGIFRNLTRHAKDIDHDEDSRISDTSYTVYTPKQMGGRELSDTIGYICRMSSLLSCGIVIVIILFNFTTMWAPIMAPTPAFREIIIDAICLVIQIEPLTDIPNVLEWIVAALKSLITFKSIFAGFIGYTSANEDKGVFLTPILFIDFCGNCGWVSFTI